MIVFVVLVVLLAGILLIRERRKIKAPQAEPKNALTEEKAGQQITNQPAIIARAEPSSLAQNTATTVTFYINAPGKKIFGSDLIILYDPEYLSSDDTQIESGDYFSQVPRKTVDQQNGIIKITAIEGRDEVLSRETAIAAVKFTTLKSGRTIVAYSFTPGTTNTTTLTERDTSQNILEKAVSAQITVE